MRQVRTIRYRDIAADLRRRLAEGELTPGRVLPSESELSGSYSASRVTIRKALEVLRPLMGIDKFVLVGFSLGFLTLASLTLRRRST